MSKNKEDVDRFEMIRHAPRPSARDTSIPRRGVIPSCNGIKIWKAEGKRREREREGGGAKEERERGSRSYFLLSDRHKSHYRDSFYPAAVLHIPLSSILPRSHHPLLQHPNQNRNSQVLRGYRRHLLPIVSLGRSRGGFGGGAALWRLW